jgi:hypothetical protein
MLPLSKIFFFRHKSLLYFDALLRLPVKIIWAATISFDCMNDFSFYFGFGWDHIISKAALDHQLFILALTAIYIIKDWKQVLVLVTAFTIGHSITLFLSVKELVNISSKWVEFLIACTIVFTAITNLFQKKFTSKSIRINYFLALFFGLIHGLGFANNIRMALASDQSLGWGLFGFNLGLEAGQIIVVLLILSLAYIVLHFLKATRREWVIFASACAFSVGLITAIERWPFK